MKPLFEHFYSPKTRGRPSLRKGNDVDTKKLSGLKAYPEPLYELGNDPLAWSFQFATRDFFAWAWDISVQAWIENPKEFPHYYDWPVFKRGNAEMFDWKNSSISDIQAGNRTLDESVPLQDFTAPNNFFARLGDLLATGPVFTIESLHRHGFAISQMGDFRRLYEIALERFSREVRPHKVPSDVFRIQNDTRLDFYAIPSNFTKSQKLDAFSTLLQQEFSRSWELSFDRLCAYGVLEWIDMRFFELLTGVTIRGDTKLEIIRRSFKTAVRLRGHEVCRELGIKEPPNDMRTTLKLARGLMDMENGSPNLEDLVTAAANQLTGQWRMSNGRGDSRFALSAKEVGSWYAD